ncbi:hypothetical protein CRENBAI_012824 [Crenichthys baileyi]|uniref:Uncharacterized protein n=1 Tax=Crenichthys baileyi TaxID=28760 RepID=A0AAV9RJV4_9TELE
MPIVFSALRLICLTTPVLTLASPNGTCCQAVIPLLLVFCQCGGANTIFSDQLSDLPFDTKEHLINYQTEGLGEDKAIYARADPAMDPETRDTGTYHFLSRRPTESRDPGPGKQPPGVSQHTPMHPTLDTKTHKYTSGQRHHPAAGRVAGCLGPTFDGGPKLREQSKTQPDKKTGTHIPALMRTHKNTHTYTPSVNTNKNGCPILTHAPHTYSILPGPDTDTPQGKPGPGPFPPGVETGRPPHHLNLGWASLG